MKLLKLLANLGYGSRKEVTQMLKNGWVTTVDGLTLGVDAAVDLADPAACAAIRVDDEVLDPLPGVVLMLNKPEGYTCSTKDQVRLVYDLLPPRFRLRKPVLSTVGRLDRETAGLLLLTDDGLLLHRVIAPKTGVRKIYEVDLAEDLRGDEAALFAAGSLLLEGEETPLAPAGLVVLGPRQARVCLSEGRYHQVRRMFAATGNHVQRLRRIGLGGLTLGALAEGEWCVLDRQDIERIFAAPPMETGLP
ncbi:MAG: pseudouridine synthase [Sterolibacterium sp.]|nr:pseudouridine synthase [Sterolibacterium sp.]